MKYETEYEWNLLFEKGQQSFGRVEIYIATIEGFNVKVIINYLPQFISNSKHRDAHVTLFFQGDKKNITDGLFHWIYDDIGRIIKSFEDTIYNKDSKPIEYMLTQLFTVSKLPEFEYFTHGDFSCRQE